MSGRADVTLDPDTANAFLILASDQRGVGRGDEWTLLPNNPERFDTEPCVLGSQGFAAGRHCWEVEVVKAGDWWAVGVAQESVKRKGVLSFTPQEGIWAVGQWFGQYYAFSDPDWTPLHLTCHPRAIQVCLDFTDKQGHLPQPRRKSFLKASSVPQTGEKLGFQQIGVWELPHWNFVVWRRRTLCFFVFPF
ncbi:E3 ubiquitin-protein ligase TRIM7-like isoform X1 [Cyanistes caeruleus]|uniref:E3 ubiquitin-protein ligase TRIM7-like isoform X1 n=1 Tax=Cyanistes caeruleus TaxID=156563 RepID=UPI000CD9FB24|nr:E3 ubiquitin-protein ligase TRIM7-like isoform X1 [Cyanistes caeruleus]